MNTKLDNVVDINQFKLEHKYWMLVTPNTVPNFHVYKFFAYDTSTGMYHFHHFRNKKLLIARSRAQLMTPAFRPLIINGGKQ